MSSVEWSVLEPGAVERLVGIFLCRDNPDATRIRPSRGDGGIDVLVPDPASPNAVVVYQVKSFHKNLTNKQKGQIRRSFQRLCSFAAANGLTVTAWHLTLPLTATHENREWLRELTGNEPFPSDWRGLDYLDGLAAKYPDVVDYYLHDGKERLDRAIVALTDVLRLQLGVATAGQTTPATGPPASALQPAETIGGLAALHETLNKHDPHYRYDFSVDHERPSVPDAPGLVAAVQRGGDGRYITFKIFARFAESVLERPIPGSFTITAEPGSVLHRDVELFNRFGRPFETPAGSVTAEVDLPGGLGETIERGQLKIGMPSTRDDAFEVRLSVVDEAGAVLAEPLIKMQPATVGPSGEGMRGYGVEEHGTFTIEFLHVFDTRNIELHYTLCELNGLRPALVVNGLRFLAHHCPPHRIGIRPAYGPTSGNLTPIPADAKIGNGIALILELAEALAVIQEHTALRVDMPDLAQLTHRQLAEVLDAARLLRGETLAMQWQGIGFHLHPGVEVDADSESPFAARVRDVLKVGLPTGDIILGVRNIDLPAARIDPGSVVVHGDHKDVRLIPFGDTLAAITHIGGDDTDADL